MGRLPRLKFDEIGIWSQIKLEILKEYASAYSKNLTSQKNFHHVYIDAFSGPGIHITKKTGKFVPGSPLNALEINPPFKEYHFIDLDRSKLGELEKRIENRPNVFLYDGDCNEILPKQIFPNVSYKAFRRGLCLLDPYGLDLKWEVIKKAGEMKTIDIFLNFPVADMNRNVLWRNPQEVDASDIERMNTFWGDNSWNKIAYKKTNTLFKDLKLEEKQDNQIVAEGFRKRLKEVAGFENVPEPMPMKNSKNSIVYYLFFASQKPVAEKIVKDIFEKYRKEG